MIYKTYAEYKNKYLEAQKKYDEILSEKEELFLRTQPKATKYDKEIVSGSTIHSDSFATYVSKMEEKKIEERLDAARSILEDRRRLLKLKEEELRQSKNIEDMIFVQRYLENKPVKIIKARIPYCRSSIYGILQKIEKNIS
jgi:hypothetical protein